MIRLGNMPLVAWNIAKNVRLRFVQGTFAQLCTIAVETATDVPYRI